MKARAPRGSAWAEVCHCSSRLCETWTRQSAVNIAERFVQASQGRKTKRRHELAEAQRRAVERAAGVSFPAGAAGERAQHGPGQAGAERERGGGRGGEQPGLWHERGEDERGGAGYGREAAPGAVQELEPVGEGEAAAQAAHDGEILPVAAHPTVLALEPGRGRGGEAVGELGGAHVAAAQQRALHGVVREDEVVREAGAAAHERPGVDDALAREAPPRPVRSIQTSPQTLP